jgi:hypothetical protein
VLLVKRMGGGGGGLDVKASSTAVEVNLELSKVGCEVNKE